MGKIPDNLRKNIAANIRRCRVRKFPGRGGGKKCAEQFGVSPQQWSPWERGGRTPDELRLEQIASFFEVTVEYLRKDNSMEDNISMGYGQYSTRTPIPPGAPSTPPQQSHLDIFANQAHLYGLDYFSLFKWFYTSVFKDGLTDSDIQELSHDAFNRFLANHLNKPNNLENTRANSSQAPMHNTPSSTL